jgi:putative FmdB family regulatory protein
MPLYEYRCEKCDCQFEQLVSPRQKTPIVCPQCGSRKIKKCISCFSSTGMLHDGGCKTGGSTGFS